MAEYIEREATLRELESLGITKNMKAHRKINTIPAADVVEVVRCSECQYWHRETGYCDENSCFVDLDGVCCSPAESPMWTMFGENDFCSKGVRKGGAGDDR